MSNSSTSGNKPQQAQHILLFGASGASGLAFIAHHLSLPDTPSKPYLTLYIRPSGLSKLLPLLPNAAPTLNSTPPTSSSPSPTSTLQSPSPPSSPEHPAPRIRIVQGNLDDAAALRHALSPSDSSSTSSQPQFPRITAAISLLGAYISPWHFLTRTTPTPLSDAFRTVIIPEMRAHGVRRVLVLSTPTAYPVAGEREHMSWAWYFHNLLPAIVVPQGNAEMKGLAEAVMSRRNGQGLGVRPEPDPEPELDATVFRVPFLTDEKEMKKEKGEEGEKRGVVAGFLGPGFTETKTLARAAMVRWLLEELDRGRWVGRAPVLCDGEV